MEVVAAADGGDSGVQGPASGCCAFFVARKRRYCKMSVAAGRALCGEHAACSGTGAPVANERKRIVCPLDSKHTVYEDVLEKHLKKCNAREKPKPAYYVRDINCGENDELPSKEQVTLSSLSAEEMSALISKVQGVFQGAEAVLELRVLSHPALQQELTDPSNGKSALKHLQQQASILGHLSSLGLLGADRCYVEFGAGRGKLSHWVRRALPGATRGVSFLLVERCSTRFKVDGKHQEGDVDFRRLLIDIQHLHLGKVPQLQDKGTSVVAIGKHLCGAATDLALRCLMETLPRHGTRGASPGLSTCGEEAPGQAPGQAPCETSAGPTLGIAITLCCHHRCSWPAYVGKKYFCSQGLGPKEFNLIQRMSSWATCGWRRPTDQVPDNGNEDATREERASRQGGVEWHAEEIEAMDHAAPCQAEDQISDGRSRAEREQLGRLCKRVLDEGRVRYLCEWGLTARLQRYVEAGTTVENVLLTARSATAS